MSELSSLCDEHRTNVDPTVFPDSPAALFWTQGLIPGGFGYSQTFDFTQCAQGAHPLDTPLRVRCVR